MRNQIEGEVVRDWSEWGHRFRIEKLKEPVLKGAGFRPYRLWHNQYPCSGGQWCYDIEHAKRNADYVLSSYYCERIRKLEHRVQFLEKELTERNLK